MISVTGLWSLWVFKSLWQCPNLCNGIKISATGFKSLWQCSNLCDTVTISVIEFKFLPQASNLCDSVQITFIELRALSHASVLCGLIFPRQSSCFCDRIVTWFKPMWQGSNLRDKVQIPRQNSNLRDRAQFSVTGFKSLWQFKSPSQDSNLSQGSHLCDTGAVLCYMDMVKSSGTREVWQRQRSRGSDFRWFQNES